jgi:hypothetical protein
LEGVVEEMGGCGLGEGGEVRGGGWVGHGDGVDENIS